MKKLTLLGTAMSLALTTQCVNAEPYIGAKLGNTWLNNACEAGVTCDDSAFGGGIYLGYDFTNVFGIEAGLDYFGGFETSYSENGTVTAIDEDIAAYTLAPKFTLPLNKVDLFAKLGLAQIEQDTVEDTVFLSTLGAEYSFSDNLALRLEYQKIHNIQDKFEGMDINSLFLGLTYTFGANKYAPIEEKSAAPEPLPVYKPQPIAKMEVFKEFGTELFATDSYALTSGSETYFDEIVAIMQKYPQANLKIVGHTDSRGSEAYNQRLSLQRAKSVADYIISQGIDVSRITYRGAGELEPKASNDTTQGRKQNRRVELSIDEFEYYVE